jgi:protein TonB
VILQAVIAKDGTVSTTRVLRGNRLLHGAALDAVRRWRYRPYRMNGRAVDAATIATVDFHSGTSATR